MDDTTLISELSVSFTRQLQLYGELKKLVDSTFGKLVLSRGDVSRIVPAMERKNALVSTIVTERQRVQPRIVEWQERKASTTDSPGRRALDEVLERTERAIKEFLQSEDQMKRYLEHIVSKNGGES
jgi:hypothetical protein